MTADASPRGTQRDIWRETLPTGRESGRPFVPARDERRPVAIAAALGLHVLLGIGLIVLPPTSVSTSVPEAGIAVDILSADAFAALTAPKAPLPTAAALPAATPATPPPAAAQPQSAPSGPAMIRANHLLSERTLSNARSRGTRQALAQLAADERAEQLCGIEAMDQIELWQHTLKPDRLVAYAMADTRQTGDTLIADGAAFRSGGIWYNLSFRCTLVPGAMKIADFAFLVGTPVPRRAWDEHGLPAVH